MSQIISMSVHCIGEECANCPDLLIRTDHTNVEMSTAESVCHNYSYCVNYPKCERIMEYIRKNSNSDNEKDGV